MLTELKAALCTSPGYCKLYDTELPDGFYFAFCSSISDAVCTFDDMYEFSITFDCKPFFYLDSGQSVTVIPYSDISGTTLYNPGTVPSKPLIKLYGNGTLNCSIGGKSLTVGNVSGSVIVDSERMLVYKGAENKVDDFQGEYPEMPPGNVQVSFSGGGMISAEITGRWCRL